MNDAEPIAALEPGQITSATARPLPRLRLGRGTLTLLVLLRIYVTAAIPVVIYAFIKALGQ